MILMFFNYIINHQLDKEGEKNMKGNVKRIIYVFTVLYILILCVPTGIYAYNQNGFSIDYVATDNGEGTVTLESVNVQAADTENISLYTAVYSQNGSLIKIDRKEVDKVGENVFDLDLQYKSSETAKIFLWKEMMPVSDVCTVEPSEPSAFQNEIYVAVNGSDETGDGSIENPFASFEKAQSVVRTLNDNMNEDITVYFRGGTYILNNTIVLGAEDSGTNGYKVIYAAYPGEYPEFSGGERITGWSQDTENTNLYVAELTRDERLRQLFVNDERAYMPSKQIQGQGGYGEYTINEGEGDYAWETLTKSDGVKFNSSDLPADIKNPSDIEVQTRTTWQTQTIAIRGVESHDGYTVALFEQPYGTMAQNLSWNTAYNPSKSNTVYNVFEFLDEPGEFYFDRAEQKLYYWPREGEDMTTADVYAPNVDTLLRISGENIMSHVSNIVIDGLTFANSDWNLYEIAGSHGKTSTQASLSLTSTASNWHYSAYRSVDLTPSAVEVQSADNIEFINNTIKHTANDGLNVINDVSESKFEGNVIYDTGATGLSIGHPQHHFIGDKGSEELTGYKDPSNQHSDMEKYDTDVEGLCTKLEISNNYIRDIGKEFNGTHGISLYYGTDNKILHNHVEDTPYSGISIGWGWGYMRGADKSDTGGSTSETGETPNLRNNEIAYNRIINTLTSLSDGGAIYTLGPMRGSSIHDNYITGVGTGGYHNRGIHIDEGTRYLNIYNNVINVELAQAAVDAGSWGTNSNVYHKKGYNIITGNYASTSSYTTTGSSYEPGTEISGNHENLSGYWNDQGAIDIIRNSGLTDEYISNALGNPANLVLPSNYSITNESGITEIDVPKTIDGDIWLAPIGTTEFIESDSVKEAHDGILQIPTTEGDYYVYVIKDGNISGISDKCIKTYPVTLVTEVEERDDVIGPFWVDGEDVDYNVNLTQGSGGNIEDTSFGTAINVSEDSAVFGITKLNQQLQYNRANAIDSSNDKWGGYVDKKVNIDKSGDYYIYILCFSTASGRSYNVFVDDELSATTEGVNGEDAPIYSSSNGLNILKARIWLNNGDNTIKIQGNGAGPNFVAFGLAKAEPEIPSDGLQLWLSAEKGVVTDENNNVVEWIDLSGAEHNAVSVSENSAPVYISDTLTGADAVSFDGTDDILRFSFKDILSEKNSASIIIVSSTQDNSPADNYEGDTAPLLWWGENDGPKFAITPFNDKVSMKLPGDQTGLFVESENTAGRFSTTAIVKNGTSIEVYNKDSESLGTLSNVDDYLDIIDDYGYIGGDETSYFEGNIAEIIVYDKAVDLGVIQSINTYLNDKYYPTGTREILLTADLDILNGDQNNGVTTPGTAARNQYVKNVFGQEGWHTGDKYTYDPKVDYRAAFDGDTSTCYDGPKSGYCGVEFNSPQLITKIGYKTTSRIQRLNGAVLQGSDDGENYTDIMTISDAGTEMKYSETGADKAYRFVRLIRNDSEVLNIHELELYTTIGLH